MAGISFRAAALFALLTAGLYQYVLRDVVIKMGIGRTLQPITDFPYKCRRFTQQDVEGCEDVWLDETNRHLYLACSNILASEQWGPNGGHLSALSRYMKDSIFVLDIDKPVGDGYKMRRLTTPSFFGTAGEGSLHPLSVSGRKVPGSSKIELYLINNKPSLADPTRVPLVDPLKTGDNLADNEKTGANTTIELFEHEPGSSSMRHVRTFAHPLIVGPNNVAPIPDGSGFYISNDHGMHKTGLQWKLSPYLATGNVVYCTNPPADSAMSPTCKIVATGFPFPNGLTIHPSDPKTLYVPVSGGGKGISIYKIDPSGSLKLLHNMRIPYPLDNLSPSADGSIYAAAFPKITELFKHFTAPETFYKHIATHDRKSPPATVLKITKVKNLVNDGQEVTWSWEKVIEDAHGQVLPGTTVAVKDTKTGRLFMSGLYSYFLTLCYRF